jgi:hypothetical protein
MNLEKKSVREVICEIVRRNKRIAAIKLGVYRKGDLPFVAPDIKITAKKLRKSLRLHGYWQSVLTVCWRSESCEGSLLQAIRHAAEHRVAAGMVRTYEVPRESVVSSTFERYAARLQPDEALAVMSEVKLADGTWAHLPMADFACHDTDADLRKVLTAIRALGYKSGVVVRSGESFHFYGFQILSETEWLASLGRFLLLAPIIDVRYIAHRIIDRVCTLRVCAGGGKSSEPRVAAVLRSQTRRIRTPRNK